MMSSKSYEGYLLGLYSAMFSDIVMRCPSLRVDSERDYKRLLIAVKEHGVNFLFDTLPSFGKHLDKCLSKERLTLSGLPHLRGYRSKRVIPRLFKGLLLRVFDDFGELRSDPDVQAIRDVRQLCFAAKRFRITCPDSKTWKQVNEFFTTDAEIVQPSLQWDVGDFDSSGSRNLQFGDYIDPEPGPLFGFAVNAPNRGPLTSNGLGESVLDTIQGVADCLTSSIGRFNPSEWKSRHGPGAVADLRGGEYKYSFPNWSPKLEAQFPYASTAFSSYEHWVSCVSHEQDSHDLAIDHEPPAKLIAVPKSYSAPRLIASEPTSHQWCQQSVLDFLVSRVQSTFIREFISFDDQSKNGQLALEASKSGALATIDLSSASDRLSCWVVERAFRASPSLLDCFYAVRTRWIRQDIDRKSPNFSRLRKFSTMGSALTFPVQSLVFLMIACGVTLNKRNQRATFTSIKKLIGEVRVFGDDIIVPTDVSADVTAELDRLGFKVNHTKTFLTGKFRESCGVEAFQGHCVTKVCLLSQPSVSKPESVLSCLDSHNNFFMRGWFKTAQYQRNSVEKLGRFSFPSVEPGSGAIGWYDFRWFENRPLVKRWNSSLQVVEYRVTLPKGGASRLPVDRNSMLLQYYTEVSKPPVSREVRLGRAALRHPLKLRRVWAHVA